MSKLKIAIFSLFFLALNLNGASAKFAQKMNYETTYENALAKAKELNKPIMLVVGTKTCPWCRKFENQTLKKEMIHSIVKEQFIPVNLIRDIDKFPKQFHPKAVPTVFFIDPSNEKEFSRSMGYKNKKEYKKILEKAANSFKG